MHRRYRLARIRHELRTPINHIVGYGELLQVESEGAVPESFKADLQRICHGGERLVQLINMFFDPSGTDVADGRLGLILHELRNPINQIIGFSELLEEQAVELGMERFVEDLRKIRSAASKWLDLAQGYLVPDAPMLDPGKAANATAAEEELYPDGEIVLHAPAATGARDARPGSGRLLVIDDDGTNREMLSRRLRVQGFTVSLAENAADGMRLLRQEPFDLVLLDMIMPVVSGDQLLEQMKLDPALQHIPVIMISALDDVAGIVRCIEMGAEDYLSKPFNAVFLRARIGAALEKNRLREQEQIYLREIQAEREKSERLLHNILPRAIAERLKRGESTIADSHPEVTVLFADLVGFTSLAASLAPPDIVRLLDEIFSAFDVLAQRRGLEKIKTIGDAYMVVGGLSTARTDHCEAIADLALDMLGEIERFNAAHKVSIRIRSGMHVGPVVAGVIGRNKFIYDLWGDTVNIASRMESHGQPGCVQITREVRDKLPRHYEVEERGVIDLKGIGETPAFLLVGRKTAGATL